MKIRHFLFSAHRLPFNALFIRYFRHFGAIENHHKDGRITICNNALRKVIDEQIVILESLKTHPGSNERNFENLIVTVEAPNPMQPFWIFCCNLFPFVATFLNKGKFRCYNQNLWPRSEVYSGELESIYRSKTNIYWKKGLKVYWPNFHNAINFWWMRFER